MPEAFDTGPLSWVKDEINQSLAKVKLNFNKVAERPEEFASLRFTETYLYQVSGALDMVGLEGCKHFCSEIEKLTNQLEKQLIPVSDTVMASLLNAVDALTQYLQDLLNGMPDTPTRLYNSMKPLLDFQGKSLDISDLFYPDTTFNVPKELNTHWIEESETSEFIADQRAFFQKFLLEWLKTKNVNALNFMTEVMQNVQQIQQKNAQKTLWWVATAFTEALAQDKIADHAGAKKLCRKLDNQLRNMAQGDTKPPSQLLRNVLYYVAISERKTEAITKVKDLFELDYALPNHADNINTVDNESLLATPAELAALAQLNADLSKFKDLWSSVTLEGGLPLTAFIAKLNNGVVVQQALNNRNVLNLFNAVHALAMALTAETLKIDESIIIEVASALNLLEYAGANYFKLNEEVNEKITTQVNRLNASINGELLIAFAPTKLDHSVISAVAKQIIASLQLVEKALDAFFRDTTEVSVLNEADKPLQQVAAAFEMLEMPIPASITKLSIVYTEYFKRHAGVSTEAQFTLVAECLSMLSLYATELPTIRPESELALTNALQRLELSVAADHLTDEPLEDNCNQISLEEANSDQMLPSEILQSEMLHSQILQSEATAIVETTILIVAEALTEEATLIKAADTENSINENLPVTGGSEVEDNTAQIAENTVTDNTLVITDFKNIQLDSDDNVENNSVENSSVENSSVENSSVENSSVEVDSVKDESVEGESVKDESVEIASDAELQSIFVCEIEEVLASLAQNLQSLSVNPTNNESLIEVRRSYHTLKGSGRTIGLLKLAEVAASVEKLLILIMDHKAFPLPIHLAFIEKVSAAFAGWVAQLQADNQVKLNPELFLNEAAALASEFELNFVELKIVPQKEEVLIGGTRTLSRTFFDIFMKEAEQHLAALAEAQTALIANSNAAPTELSCRAAHTLGSNALTAGFKPTGDLARALEHWLDEHTGQWTEQHIALYGNVVKALQEGLAEAKALKNPKSTRALIIALGETLNTMQVVATQEAEMAVFEVQAAELKSDSLKNTANETVFSKELTGIESPATEEINLTSITTLPFKALNAINPEPLALNALGIGSVQKNTSKSQAVDLELLTLFVEEARELVPQLGSDLRSWKANPEESDYTDSIQRVLHTLKGSARMAGQTHIGDSVHNMEDRVIQALKHKVTANDFDEMFIEFDRVGLMLEDITGNVTLKVQNVDSVKDKPETLNRAPARSINRKAQYLRMRADVLDRLINEAGEVSIMRSRMDREMQNFKHSSIELTDSISRLRSYLRELEIEAETQLQSRMSLLQEANETFDPLEFDRFTRLQELTRMMAESVNDVATIQHGFLLNLDQTDAALQQQNRMNRELQQGLMGVRMLPFATIAERLQRIVRLTARELNKRVELTIVGESTEIDRGVLDKMGAPLEHLLRNAVAHGLEATEERHKLGKPEIGQIKLKISLENDEITLIISDDGAGINLVKVKQKAIEKGLFKAEETITDDTLMAVIFEAGFSTADTVTQIAGRGVGLDVVRSDIAELGGRIDVSNESGNGALFNIYLPVTLSVVQVVMVRINNKIFAIPSVMVEQVQKLKQNALTLAYQAKKIEWSEREYPLYFLSRLIGDIDHVAESHVYTPVIMLRSGTYRTAVHVDEIIGNQEVVMKQMGSQLARVPGMIGATVMGDGAIVLVINPVQLANREALSIGALKVHTASPVIMQTKRVALVVDDSLTMRKVFTRVLEREDFEVITANDGMDAIQKLQFITPHIILTDIEMPRMDGFEFSRHVRDNAKTAKTPLIIISSRTAEKHRLVATELGVDAFLGKPVQDDELIEQINALLN